jgi:phosphoribosylglycinamide formyltransferase 1
MKKLDGLKKVSTAVFISGSGSNLKNLINHSKKKNSKFKINLVVSNNFKAKGLNYANKENIKKKVIDYTIIRTAEKKILLRLKKNKIKLICLAGFMRIISKSFIKNFKGKIINIHPSLLPKYKGLNTHQRVIENNEKYSGCTVHFVSPKLDSGKIIMQKRIKVFKNDTATKLAKRVLQHEHRLYPKALNKILLNL